MKLSINRAWEEAAGILKRDFGTLFLIAFALTALPQIALQALGPAAPPAGSGAGLILVMMVVVLLVGMIGNVAIAALALGRESVVGSALRHGLRRAPPLFAATMLLFVALLLVAGVVATLNGLTPETALDGGKPSAAATRSVTIMLLIGVAVGTKFLLTTQVAAGESGGPIAILRRSWRLTNGIYWRLLGFFLVVVIAYLLIAFAVTAVLGIVVALVAGPPQPGSLGALIMLLVSGAFNAAFVAIFITTLSRIYVQAAGEPSGGAATTGV